MTAVGIPPALAPANRPATLRRLASDSLYVLTSLPLALANFVVGVVGFALGIGLVVTVVGLPVLSGTLATARAFAQLERHRMAGVLAAARVQPRYVTPGPDAGTWRRVLAPLTDPQSWLDLGFGVLRLPVTLIAVPVTVAWWTGALAGSLYWTYDWLLPADPDGGLAPLLGLGDAPGTRIALYTAIGLFFLVTLPIVVRGCALLQAGLARGLLTGVAQMRDRITDLEEQRQAAVSAEATALRRLERDIHDGPQQRLVRLAMDLGRAREQLAADPDAARRTLDEALDQTRETLAELRALSRGIAPPILVDRGLPSALAALAGRGVIPVDLSVDPRLGTAATRPDPAVESSVYFVVAEALTNIAKHSGATACSVGVHRHDGGLTIVVADDGTGGAHLAKGHGLAGLADRVRAHGGTLAVHSPPGGPTEVRAELPG
ncbi:signal transduction histidine kinase [Micromonospora sp. Llam0]|uniref:sensor histidine kinase n=1 Tax=Micromonospora sp. Llam0 TaxID=2485143 RepID=UPI000F46E997|nr:sensor histidine kinase [Micromonospora sp. Llam0]ROO51353.1 signal transduction histidine kinase [Micromonospora sp. Llam0]